MRAKHYLCLTTTTESMAIIWYQYNTFKHSSGLSGGSVVVYALFTVVPHCLCVVLWLVLVFLYSM